MRPAGRSETDSLYFTYPRFETPARRPAPGAAVAIVGAGPVGMTAALALAREGVRSVLLVGPAPVGRDGRDGDALVARDDLGLATLEDAHADLGLALAEQGQRRGRGAGRQALEMHQHQPPEDARQFGEARQELGAAAAGEAIVIWLKNVRLRGHPIRRMLR